MDPQQRLFLSALGSARGRRAMIRPATSGRSGSCRHEHEHLPAVNCPADLPVSSARAADLQPLTRPTTRISWPRVAYKLNLRGPA